MNAAPPSELRSPNSVPRILGVNGIRSQGEKNTDRLLEALARLAHEVVDFNYGRVNFFTARSVTRQKAIGHRLRELSQTGDHVVAHSYGCLVTLRAMQSGARFGHVWLFAPAMNADFTFPWHAAQAITIVHCRTDLALLGGSLLVKHAFGAMGRTGYQGPYDARVRNIEVNPRFLAHSAYFAGAELGHWAALIDQDLRRSGGIPAPTQSAPTSDRAAGIPART